MMSAPSAFSKLMEEWGTENPRETPTTTEKTATATSSLTKNLRRGTGPSGRPPSPSSDHSGLVSVETTARTGRRAVNTMPTGSGSPTAMK